MYKPIAFVSLLGLPSKLLIRERSSIRSDW